MAVILSIETSTAVCSAALHENGNLLAAKELNTPQSAASQLAVQIQELMEVATNSSKKLNAVAVSCGPGSYTGLRIGVATAKGLCFGLNIPLIAIDSLAALAARIPNPQPETFLCPMIDARRMEVYCSILDSSMRIIAESQAKIIDEYSFIDYLELRPVWFFGDGSAKCQSTINHPNANFVENVYCHAVSMGKLALDKFQTGQFADSASFEPNYLKNFVAKTKST